MKSKKLVIYENKRQKNLMMCPTQENFRQKNMNTYGLLLNKNISDAELGKAVREMLLKCD